MHESGTHAVNAPCTMQLALSPHCPAPPSSWQSLLQKYVMDEGSTTWLQRVPIVQSLDIVQYLPTPKELPMSPGWPHSDMTAASPPELLELPPELLELLPLELELPELLLLDAPELLPLAPLELPELLLELEPPSPPPPEPEPLLQAKAKPIENVRTPETKSTLRMGQRYDLGFGRTQARILPHEPRGSPERATQAGGPRGTRTLDLRIKSPQLCRLSYRPGP
jgi:hypothetical protein